jgi:hypothetical protein
MEIPTVQKRVLAMMLAAGVFGTATAIEANAPADGQSQGVLNIAVYGDSPYGTANSDTAQFNATPAFIQKINANPDVSLVLHVGDIHSGKQLCSKAYDQSIFDMWKSFRFPVVYTPGDNEWTDCQKSGEIGGERDPLVNLGFVRDIFFANPGHSIAVDKAVFSQKTSFDPNYPTDANYVENVMWEQSGVVFVTLNVPGGSNNDEDNWANYSNRTQPQTDEILQRTGADLRWLDQAFGLAKDVKARAVVIELQADMWDLDGKAPSHIGAYRQFVDSIALHASAFGKPVLLLNGDSHVFRSDNPLVKGAPCVIESGASDAACSDDAYDNQPYEYDVKNFHRIVVHGSTAPMEWLKLAIKQGDSDGRASVTSFGPFSWQRMIQTLP